MGLCQNRIPSNGDANAVKLEMSTLLIGCGECILTQSPPILTKEFGRAHPWLEPPPGWSRAAGPIRGEADEVGADLPEPIRGDRVIGELVGGPGRAVREIPAADSLDVG